MRDAPDYLDAGGTGQTQPVVNTPVAPSGDTAAPENADAGAQSTPAPAADKGDAVTDAGVVRPIRPPEGKLRIGFYQSDIPWYVSDEAAERTNYTASWVESAVSDYQRDQGVSGTEADKRAAATVTAGAAGAVAGGLAGGTLVAVPAAAACVGPGMALGAGLGTPVIPPIGPVAGTLVGGTAAATACGAAGLAAGGAAGAALGGGAAALAANAFGAGEVDPVDEFALPQIDRPDADAAYRQAHETIYSLDRENPAAADAVRGAVNAGQQAQRDAATATAQAREAIAGQPGGEAILAAADHAAAEAAVITGPAATAVGDAAAAATAAVTGDPQPAPTPTPAPQQTTADAANAAQAETVPPASAPVTPAAAQDVSPQSEQTPVAAPQWRSEVPEPVAAAVDAAPPAVGDAVDAAAAAVQAALPEA
ncbi:hypothetical protein FO059_18215 (plasmid) [Tomitella fengzijianii]|uniref:Uncharacterized protein n=1 Tax=Tomitella fengzijianii TaxID=2597660 RepID=A0A516X8Y0_9ACTN|nr:hypothetical protein [Tomitella fengzijianii]QDQ99530.1 hypothetical protein FO059_18215 [Tomitella fengzijianii]